MKKISLWSKMSFIKDSKFSRDVEQGKTIDWRNCLENLSQVVPPYISKVWLVINRNTSMWAFKNLCNFFKHSSWRLIRSFWSVAHSCWLDKSFDWRVSCSCSNSSARCLSHFTKSTCPQQSGRIWNEIQFIFIDIKWMKRFVEHITVHDGENEQDLSCAECV